MSRWRTFIWKLRLIKDTRGQDLTEFALMVGFVAVAAGAVTPSITTSMRSIYERISGILSTTASQQ